MKFWDYYRYYLSLHQDPRCRRMHVAGQIFTLLFVILILVKSFTVSPWLLLLLLLTPFLVYPWAWFGHFYFEKNKPAAFKNPLWAKACDWVMMWDMLRGRIPF
jgi:hypothetical protein